MIVNLSAYQLSDVEKSALSRGLNFALTPPKIRKGKYLANFEMLYNDLGQDGFFSQNPNDDQLYFQSRLKEIAFSSLYNFNELRRNHRDNISREERHALHNLSKNQDIRVMKPDKGSGDVIMNTVDYNRKMEEIIHGTTKFASHSNQDIYMVCRSIERKEQYKKLYPNGLTISVLYRLPKVHKDGTPMRPICSAVGSATYELSKYLTRIIKPASINRHGTDFTDTFQFVRQTTGMDLSGKFMVSFDVKPLFTNVPLKEIIDVTIRRMYHSDFITPPVIPENNLRELLELCVSDNLFLFNGKVFKQTME